MPPSVIQHRGRSRARCRPLRVRRVTGLIDPFMPSADIAEAHESLVRAPADLVVLVASNFEMQSLVSAGRRGETATPPEGAERGGDTRTA